jgi:hypothetical protein
MVLVTSHNTSMLFLCKVQPSHFEEQNKPAKSFYIKKFIVNSKLICWGKQSLLDMHDRVVEKQKYQIKITFPRFNLCIVVTLIIGLLMRGLIFTHTSYHMFNVRTLHLFTCEHLLHLLNSDVYS